MKKLGDIISDGRKLRGYSIQEAADQIGISRMTLARLEADQTRLISIDNLLEISNTLDIDFYEMLVTHGKKLINCELRYALKLGKRIYFDGILIDKDKLENLIKENIEQLEKNELE